MTTIEWTQRPGTKGESWNPIRARNRATGGLGHFCEHVSEGCRNCYAERLQPRFKNKVRYAAQDRDKVEIRLDEAAVAKPLRWRAPRTVFVCSMTDLFGPWVEEDWLDRIFAVMALTPRHTYQVLTKRPARMRDYSAALDPAKIWDLADEIACEIGLSEFHPSEKYLCAGKAAAQLPLSNVWLGVSVEDQAAADGRLPALLDTPAAVRFVSYEPALGPVDLDRGGFSLISKVKSPTGKVWPGLDWVIAGGESGPKARPAAAEWFRGVRDQCAAAGVPFFFKQWGAWAPGGEHLPFRGATHVWLDGAVMHRIGKNAAGRRLDGKEHLTWPR